MERKILDNPCYDKSTKTSCPHRKVGCAATCEEWSRYLEERDKEYKRRLQQRVALDAEIAGMLDRKSKFYRRSIRNHKRRLNIK
jgi:hypothetical protein